MNDRQLKNNPLEETLTQLLNEQKNYEFYYLMVIKLKYYNQPNSSPRNRQYNTLYYTTAFHLVDGIPEANEYSKAISINDKCKYKFVMPMKELLTKIKGDLPKGKKLVIFANLKKAPKKAMIEWYNKIEEIPEFRWVLFDTFKQITTCMANAPLKTSDYENFNEGFKILKKIELNCNKLDSKNTYPYGTFQDEKKVYLSEIKTIISTKIEQ